MMFGERPVLALILLISVAALAAAFTAQFVFGLQPCILCYWQRVPFYGAAALAVLALLPGVGRRVRVAVIALCGLLFLINSGIAVFHVGVEQLWWAGTEACGGEPVTALSVEDMQRMMRAPIQARCDEVAWSLFGISMAGYNVVFSLVLGISSLWAAARLRRQG